MSRLGFFLLFLSTACLGLYSCNQVGLGALTAAKNVITSPIDGISSLLSNRRYNEVEERTPSEARSVNSLSFNHVPKTSEVIRCEVQGPRPILERESDLESLMGATRSSACSCKAWGSCSQDVCECAKLCPNDFSLFKRAPFEQSTADLTSNDHSLSFRNADSMTLSSIEGTNGYCWGHASTTAQFNRLATFDPSETQMKSNLDAASGSPERSEALSYYKGVIDKVTNNKVSTIDGFANLNELSSHPDLESYIADKVAKAWASRAMSFQGLRTALGTGAMSQEKSSAFLEDVAKKIDNFQQPQIVFTAKGNAAQTHAVLVSHYERDESGLTLCLRDNNEPPTVNKLCLNRMFVDDDGGIHYSPWGKIGRAAIAHNDQADTLKHFDVLKEECDRLKGCK